MSLFASNYRSAKARANLAKWLLLTFILASMFSIAVVSLEINLLMKVEAGEIVSAEAIASNDTRRMALAVLYICVFIATILAFCRWINRASRNLRELDVYNQEFSPRWAVGWWFIPLWNFAKPYRVMREIWKASDPRIQHSSSATWNQIEVTALMGWWWGIWTFGEVSIYFSDQLYEHSPILSDWAEIISDAGSLVAAILIIMIIKRITSMQDAKYKALTTTHR